MKKLEITLLSICLIVANLVQSQLKVANNGYVGIQIGANTPLSPLTIGGVGSSANKVNIDADTYSNGLRVSRSGGYSQNQLYGVFSFSSLVSSNATTGLGGYSYSSTVQTSGRAWGVNGFAGNATSGYNYGVMGTHYGSNNGAGVVGTVSGNQDVNVPGIYAGYFVGNVKVTGVVTAQNITSSDKRLKKNIVQLDKAKSLSGILSLNPVEYNLQQRFEKTNGDTTKVKSLYYDEESQLFKKKHFGLIAQELQQIYPELVYEDSEGYLAVDYVGLIPLLIQSIKEIRTELDLKNSNANSSLKIGNPQILDINNITYPILEQNNPNPFNTSTIINFALPKTIMNAAIYVYNMNGEQLNNYAISTKGKGSIVINGSEYNAGMYLYALIADGKVIDTKRMILTK
jgi:hypothetical protein